jgi:hypothetical protein
MSNLEESINFQSWIKDIIVKCYKFKTSSLNQLPPFAHCRFPFVLEIYLEIKGFDKYVNPKEFSLKE